MNLNLREHLILNQVRNQMQDYVRYDLVGMNLRIGIADGSCHREEAGVGSNVEHHIGGTCQLAKKVKGKAVSRVLSQAFVPIQLFRE
jgi:hypothetical protein